LNEVASVADNENFRPSSEREREREREREKRPSNPLLLKDTQPQSLLRDRLGITMLKSRLHG
jgi:hypothetical protein